jgi:hypothetical protein
MHVHFFYDACHTFRSDEYLMSLSRDVRRNASTYLRKVSVIFVRFNQNWNGTTSMHLWLYSPCGPWPLYQFLSPRSVGVLGRVISSSEGRYLHTEQHTE